MENGSLSNASKRGGSPPRGILHKRQIRDATLAKALFAELFDESHAAKIVKVAQDFLESDVRFKDSHNIWIVMDRAGVP
jgi:hypothetical protein